MRGTDAGGHTGIDPAGKPDRTDVEYDAYVRVKIKSGHALMLYYTEVSSTVGTGTGHCSWAPLSNDEFE